MTQTKALRLALEALETLMIERGSIYDKAITAIKAALEAKDETHAYGYAKRLAEAIWSKHYKTIAPQWEPFDELIGVLTQIDNMTSGLISPQQKEAKNEPVAWMYSPTGALFDICPNDADEGEFLPLYTTPPQRTWVKLTEEEIKPCWYEACQTDLELTSQLVVYFARAIEAKLKEKNT